MTLYALCLGFILGCPFWATLWFAVLRRKRWPADALCPHRKQPEPFIGKWTPAHAMRR